MNRLCSVLGVMIGTPQTATHTLMTPGGHSAPCRTFTSTSSSIVVKFRVSHSPAKRSRKHNRLLADGHLAPRARPPPALSRRRQVKQEVEDFSTRSRRKLTVFRQPASVESVPGPEVDGGGKTAEKDAFKAPYVVRPRLVFP